MMDLFSPLVAEERFHPNFKNTIEQHCAPQRAVLNEWVDGFVDRDNKFVKEFQTTYNSSFWELYLHAVIKLFGMENDWNHPAPDFVLESCGHAFIIEATTANSAEGKLEEWTAELDPEKIRNIDYNEFNREGIIRLANAILSKGRKYKDRYGVMNHVKGKPFVIAVAPFDQPYAYMQLDRPITALLYDYYVDEEEYLRNPESYPYGPPTVHMGSVEKDNGSEIILGLFNDDSHKHISAVFHSHLATWGKLDALCELEEGTEIVFNTLRATLPIGQPEHKAVLKKDYSESLVDGIHIYHNPYAEYPLDVKLFEADGVIQHYQNKATGEWEHDNMESRLIWRQPIRLIPTTSELYKGSIL